MSAKRGRGRGTGQRYINVPGMGTSRPRGSEEFSFKQPTGPRVDASSNSPINFYSRTVTPEVIGLNAEETNK